MTLEQYRTINPAVIIELIGDDPKEIKEFQLNFLYQAKGCIQKMIQYYKTQDFAQLKGEAHYLKTSAKAIGAELCGHYLQQLEVLAAKEDLEQCKLQLARIAKELEAVKQGIVHDIKARS
ncbi:Hpt domain-containing protein [Pseudoalteromonas fenneropenaei]|uniref:Hpt domain-containing protein n=1 Tax=Pseudoalteromonas fenneropenaei TaxID=1737459 RepID=A0ABV7CJC7_9GAMM